MTTTGTGTPRPHDSGRRDKAGRVIKLADRTGGLDAATDEPGLKAAINAALADCAASAPVVERPPRPVSKKPPRGQAAKRIAEIKAGRVEIEYSGWKYNPETHKRERVQRTGSLDARMLYTPGAGPKDGELYEGRPQGGQYQNWKGGNCERSRPVGEDAAMHRHVLNAVAKDPEGPLRHVEKIQVKSSHNSIDVRLRFDHDAWVNYDDPTTVPNKWGDAVRQPSGEEGARETTDKYLRMTPEASEAVAAVERLVRSTNWDGGDIQTDYFDTKHYTHVTVWNGDY